MVEHRSGGTFDKILKKVKKILKYDSTIYKYTRLLLCSATFQRSIAMLLCKFRTLEKTHFM